MKEIKIYQIAKGNGAKYRFQSYDFAQANGFSLSDYTLVYDCTRDDNYSMDSLFYEFNCNHPADFTGHSLSVSDVVECYDIKWYCDDCGWVRIEEE